MNMGHRGTVELLGYATSVLVLASCLGCSEYRSTFDKIELGRTVPANLSVAMKPLGANLYFAQETVDNHSEHAKTLVVLITDDDGTVQTKLFYEYSDGDNTYLINPSRRTLLIESIIPQQFQHHPTDTSWLLLCTTTSPGSFGRDPIKPPVVKSFREGMAWVRKSSSSLDNKSEDVLTYFASVCIALRLLRGDLGDNRMVWEFNASADTWLASFAGIEKAGWANKRTVNWDRGDESGEASLYVANLGGNRVRMELRHENIRTLLQGVFFLWILPGPH